MSWQKHFTTIDPKKSLDLALKRSQQNQGNGYGKDSTSKHSSFLPEFYAGHSGRIQRYSQYDSMDNDPEINQALNIIADFCTQIEEKQEGKIFQIHYKSEPTAEEGKILKLSLEQWITMNDLVRKVWEIFRKTIKYGDQFFIRDPETLEWLWVEHTKVDKVMVNEAEGKEPEQYIITDLDLNLQTKVATSKTEYQTVTTPFGNMNNRPNDPRGFSGASYAKPNSGTASRFVNEPNATAVDAKHMVHISLNIGLDNNWPFGTSVLEPIYKTFKQKELLEDSILIYRIQRAPERRIFYVDVGNMPPHRAAQYIERIKNDIHQKRIPNRTGGGSSIIDATYNPLAQLDDYFFATTSEGRGSKVETLPGGDNLGQIQDLLYFNNKLLRGLGVPAAYVSTGPEDNQAAYSDGRVGTAFIQEYRFTRYCQRLQNIVVKVIDQEFKRYVAKCGFEIDSSLYELKFNQPQNFAKFAQIERDTAQIQVFQPLAELKYFSKRYLMKRYLDMSEEDMDENLRLWKEENAEAVEEKTGLKPDELEGSTEGMSGIGIRPGGDDLGGDMDLEGGGDLDGEGGGDAGDMGGDMGGDAGDAGGENPLM